MGLMVLFKLMVRFLEVGGYGVVFGGDIYLEGWISGDDPRNMTD